MRETLIYKLSIRIVLLALIFIGLNEVYKKYFFDHDLKEFAEIKQFVDKIPNETEVLYVGESSNISFHENDQNRSAISDLIAQCLPNENIYDLTKTAGHSGIYKELLKQLPQENNIHTIILTLNMRTFNAQCIYSHLETALQQDLVLLRDYPPLVNRASLSFKNYDIKNFNEREEQVHTKWEKETFPEDLGIGFKNVKKWYKSIEKAGVKDENGNYSEEYKNLAATYIKSFGFVLDTNNNPRIEDFNKILAYANKKNWKVLFNLLPEDVEGAEKWVGTNLSDLMVLNAKVLEKYYTNKGYKVVNNIDKVANDQFIDIWFPTEHYAEKGRKTIAQGIAVELSKMRNKKVPSDSFNSILFNTTPLVYFNNCERNLYWDQWQNITNEKAYNSKHSSVIHNQKPFSITCNIPWNAYKDTIKSLEIDAMLFANVTNDSMKFVFEAKGEKIEYFAQEKAIKDFKLKNKEWQKVTFSFPIPANVKDADEVLVYLYNPSMEKVYLDDFRVSIKK